ncbi:MAG: M56 family metallopeptidase [Luteibacter sp.]
MSAITIITSGLAAISIGAVVVIALSRVEGRWPARWRHRMGSAAFWGVAILPFALPFAPVIHGGDDLAWSATVVHVLPMALPAQHWLTQVAWGIVALMLLSASTSGARLIVKLRLALGMAAALRAAHTEGASVVVADVPGTMLLGYRRPLVVLSRSASAASPTVRYAIERHERAHAVRHDNWRLLAENLVMAALPWCRPLRRVHDFILSAREELCDAFALQGADDATRIEYARALLTTLRRTSPAAHGVSTMTGSLAGVRRRMLAILQDTADDQGAMKQRRASAYVAMASLLALALLMPALGSSLETIAGLRGESLRFTPLAGGPGNTYRISALGGTTAAGRLEPGDYHVVFARNAAGKWVVTTKPATR